MQIVESSFEIKYPRNEADWLFEAQMIEEAARNCYKSQDKITPTSYKDILRTLMQNEHFAMIEFGNFICRIITDRGVTHELVRHRIASYAQESTRFCNYGKDKFGKEITVVIPHGIKRVTEDSTDEEKEKYINWHTPCKIAEKSYFDLLEKEVKPQIARSVLPTSLKTEIYFKCNWTELLHIFKMRCSEKAHPDIRNIFIAIREKCAKYMPEVFSYE